MAVGSYPLDSTPPHQFSMAEWVARKEKEAYKLERNKMLFDAALAIITHSTHTLEGAFDKAEGFIKEYERRVNGER